MKKKIYTWLILSICCVTLQGQISTKELSYSWIHQNRNLSTIIPIITMRELDMKKIEAEDLSSDNSSNGSFRYGVGQNINLTLENSGVWNNTNDGGRLWQLKIHSPSAQSLDLVYDKFWLPEGAKFFIYSADNTKHIGAFTQRNNKGDNTDNIRGFATQPIFTNTIVLEYYEPATAKQKGIISVEAVVSGYRGFAEMGEDVPLRAVNSCYLDVLGAAGANWQQEKNAVACMYRYQGESMRAVAYCTGALLNNVANDNAPYFLTAYHCIDDFNNVDWDKCSFRWQYEGNNSGYYTVGAQLLSYNPDTDFALLYLLENPAYEGYPYYLGWDRSGVPATSGVCIEHPDGLPRKIAIEHNPVVTAPYGGNPSSTGNHWLTVFDEGKTWYRASGSPFINQDKRVIGQLHGGQHFDCYTPERKYFGRFDLSWEGYDKYSRLKDWLDPFNTNIMVLNGTGYCTEFVTPTFSVQTIYCSGSNIPALPTMSDEGITGSWFPALSNTATMTYTFTPIAGQCAIPQTLTITINNNANINFISQNITINQSVINNCGDITIHNVTVTNNAKLTFDATGTTTIEKDFEMELGTELEIK